MAASLKLGPLAARDDAAAGDKISEWRSGEAEKPLQ
jgi:hypothetical protein